MGTSYGVNRTLANDATIANRIGPGLVDGRVKVMYDEFTFAGETAGEIVQMGPKLPLGATILDVILDTVDLANAVQLEVGDYEDPNRYIEATDHGSGAAVTRLNANAGRGYKNDETDDGATASDRQIIITTSVAAATGLAKLAVLYTTD